MNFKHLLAVAALSIPGLISAVPADPRPREITNPDGSVVTVRVHGDEFFNFMTDEACTRILCRDARGFVTDMVRDGRVVEFNRANVTALGEEARARFADMEGGKAPSSMQRMAALDNQGRSYYPTIGKGIRSLVVLVEFEDVSFTVENPREYYTRQLNEPGFSDYAGKGSAADYYKAVSNGLYEPQFDVYGPVKVNYKASYFKDFETYHMKDFVKESLTALHDTGEVDFSDYDYDEDGIVDTVFFYYAGYGASDSETETIWPHQFDYSNFGIYTTANLRFDGKKIGPYACGNELKGWNPLTGKRPWKDGSTPWVDGIGTFVHEYGHVLGLPDLYDINYDPETLTPGDMSVMCSGSYNFNSTLPPLFSAYEQWVCHWLEFTEAGDGSDYTIPALGTTDADSNEAVRIPIPRKADGSTIHPEFFVVEARDKSGWDLGIPESGIYIWRVNYKPKYWTNNIVNNVNSSNLVVHYAVDADHPAFTEGAIYPGSANELIPSQNYDYWKSPIITGISYDTEARTGHFEFNVLSEMPTGAPVLHENPVRDESGSHNFTLTWDPIEGADSYLLTIKSVGSGLPLGGYDEYNVGDASSFKVAGIPAAEWNNELEAYVRAVKVVPCTDTSNVVRFVPSELSITAVDAIGSDGVSISGGVGCISAPEGAAVYDLSGRPVGLTGLAPGVYIVVHDSITREVIVR